MLLNGNTDGDGIFETFSEVNMMYSIYEYVLICQYIFCNLYV